MIKLIRREYEAGSKLVIFSALILPVWKFFLKVRNI